MIRYQDCWLSRIRFYKSLSITCLVEGFLVLNGKLFSVKCKKCCFVLNNVYFIENLLTFTCHFYTLSFILVFFLQLLV